MGSILISKGRVESVAGPARHVRYSDELGVCQEFPGRENLPPEISLGEYLALQYFPPPQEAMRAVGAQNTTATVDALFGAGGGRVEYQRELVPTSARWEDCRAWVVRSHWDQTYSMGTHLQHTVWGSDALGALWLHIPTIREWAGKMFSTPLGRIILQHEEYGKSAGIVLPDDQLLHELGPFPKIWGGQPHCDKDGVFFNYFCKWGKRSCLFRRNIPGGWVVEKRTWRFKGHVFLPATVYRNGTEELVFVGQRDDGKQLNLRYLEHKLPDAFPLDQEGGGHLLALSEEWARIALAEGL